MAAKLRQGDLVVQPVSAMSAPPMICWLLWALILGQPLQLKVLRGSEQMELSIEPAPLPVAKPDDALNGPLLGSRDIEVTGWRPADPDEAGRGLGCRDQVKNGMVLGLGSGSTAA